jgi:hypothetical protein
LFLIILFLQQESIRSVFHPTITPNNNKMIIIGTRTTVGGAPPLDQQKVLGNDPTCVRPECPGVCRLYQVKRYCTLYFIPVTKCGPVTEIVKCERCELAVELDAFLEYQKRLQAASKV